MSTPTSWSSVTAIPLSGIQNIDALHDDTRWASSTITYSFPGNGASWSTDTLSGYGPSSGTGEPWRSSYGPLSSPGAGDDQTYFTSALQKWANVANLRFVQVTDTPSNVGDIRAAYTVPTDEPSDTVAWAYYPGNAPAAGDIWFSTLNVAATDRWTPGSFAFLAVMHEMGHALGLKHPFEASAAVNVTMPVLYDSQSYTIMSYAASPGDDTTHFSYSPTTPMVLDVAAIQYVYGANESYHAADDLYTFNDTDTYHETIWDAGGSDTIEYKGQLPAIIDLRDGAGSTIGQPVYVVSHFGANLYAINNVWIAADAMIENAKGGSADDVIKGNDVANSLMGGLGNDSLDGGAGVDTAVFAGSRAAFIVTKTNAGITVKGAQGEGTDSLTNIERLKFSDKGLAWDLLPTEHAGQALEFIGLMAPGMIRTPTVVGDILGLFDQGQSLQEVCQLALDVGVVNAFAGSNSRAALAAMAYRNVMGSGADPAMVDSLVGYMDGRHASYSPAEFMTVVAGLELNQVHIGLLGLRQIGVEFA